jgi:hypothetical protein
VTITVPFEAILAVLFVEPLPSTTAFDETVTTPVVTLKIIVFFELESMLHIKFVTPFTGCQDCPLGSTDVDW